MDKEKEAKEQTDENLDFVQIFHQRLEAIEIGSEMGRKYIYLLRDIEKVGLKGIKKVAEGIIFSLNKKDRAPFYLWIKDPKDIKDEVRPHGEVLKDLQEAYLPNPPHTIFLHYSALIIQDNEDNIHLLFDDVRTFDFNHQINRESLIWLNFLERFNITKIIGKVERDEIDEDGISIKSKILTDRNLLGEIRQEKHIEGFAKEKGMTRKQYQEFRRKVLEAEDSKTQISWTEIAESVLFPGD